MEFAEIHEASGPVTAVFSRRIKPDQTMAFEEWLHEMTALATTRPGYLGATVLRPSDKAHPEYVTILRFASAPQLMAWETDPARAVLMARADALAIEPLRTRRDDGMELWFTPSGAAPSRPPPKWKMALLLTAAIFILTQIVPRLLGPGLAVLPGVLATLAVVAINVSLVTWLIMPQLTRRLAFWLFA